MAVLNQWQKVSRVLGGDWGDAKDGSATISSDPNVRTTITGTAGQTTATAGATTISNGDLVVLHQTQGTGAGQWEFNLVVSGGGSTSLVFAVPNHYTFATGAQIIKVPRYLAATISAHTTTAWNGSVGGIEVILAKTSITVSGALNGNGGNGAKGIGSIAGGTGGGFRGGAAKSNGSGHAYSGDGSVGNTLSQSAYNGNGGGGGRLNQNGGGGGGNATAGGNGQNVNGGTFGVGGTAVGSTDLLTIFPGGGGGGGCKDSVKSVSSGASGGAIFILISKSITLSAGVTVNGGSAIDCADGEGACGGGGAGGSVLGVCDTATLGTNQITATAGGTSTTGADGGAGSVGRIAVHHSGTVTGTTNPTFVDVDDTSLRDISGAFLAFL